jgi:DNA-binding ferritin-like protein
MATKTPMSRQRMVVSENGMVNMIVDRLGTTGKQCPLFDVVVALQHGAMIHQFNHWFANGPAFGSLHALFGEAYALCNDDADAVAERALMREEPLAVMHRLRAISELEAARPSANVTIEDSIAAEQAIICACEAAIEVLQSQDKTQGVCNLLQGICDSHDVLEYKLTMSSM